MLQVGSETYVIRGGIDGRERLRILARVMRESTTSLLDRLDLRDGMSCLDAGCGGGDVTRELARRVAPHGKAAGADIDETKLELCRQEARGAGLSNIEFLKLDIGPRVPLLLKNAGFEDVQVSIVQPMGLQGEMKLLSPITMENIADAVLKEGLATREEIATIARDLYDFAADPNTLAGLPRIVQSRARKP